MRVDLHVEIGRIEAARDRDDSRLHEPCFGDFSGFQSNKFLGLFRGAIQLFVYFHLLLLLIIIYFRFFSFLSLIFWYYSTKKKKIKHFIQNQIKQYYQFLFLYLMFRKDWRFNFEGLYFFVPLAKA